MNFFENGLLDKLEAGKFSALKAIHKYLFDKIYDFVGELRTVNISKGNFRFAPLMYLEAALASIDKMPQSTLYRFGKNHKAADKKAFQFSPAEWLAIHRRLFE